MASNGTPPSPRPNNKSAVTTQQAFRLLELYPDAASLFEHRHPVVQDVLRTCMVVLDASVLLYAYELKSESLEEIGRLYKRLIDHERLVVPGQSAREFFKVRSAKVAWIVDKLDTAISSAERNPMSENIRLLENNEQYKIAKNLGAEIVNKGKELKKNLTLCRNELEAAVGNDPVSTLYRELLPSAVVELNLSNDDKESFVTELHRRNSLKIAPGFTDQDKEDGGSGDLLIWKTLLSEAARRKVDCIFVTEERKEDWWIKSKGSSFQPRPELIDEYRRESGGKSIFLMPLSSALAQFSVEKEIVAEVQHIEDADRRLENYLINSERFSLSNMIRELENLRDTQVVLIRKRKENIAEIESFERELEYLGSHLNTFGNIMSDAGKESYDNDVSAIQHKYLVAQTRKTQIERELETTLRTIRDYENRIGRDFDGS